MLSSCYLHSSLGFITALTSEGLPSPRHAAAWLFELLVTAELAVYHENAYTDSRRLAALAALVPTERIRRFVELLYVVAL